MKILFIITGYSRQKKDNANVICMKKIFRKMKSNNELIVMTDQNFNSNSIEVRKEDEITIHHIPNLYKGKARKILFNNWVKDAYDYYQKNIEKEQIDIVVSVTNDFETVWIGNKIKNKNSKIKWLVYQLDPYSQRYGLNKIKVLIKQRIETKLFSQADKVLLLPELFEEIDTSSKENYMEIGIPLLENLNHLNQKHNQENVIKCVYAGTFYEDIRNPEYMLSLFDELSLKNNKITLHLYSSGCEGIVEFYSGKNNNIKIHTHKSNKEMTKILSESDFLISIGNKAINQVPSKIFEYMSLGKPIINFSQIKPDSSNKYLSEYFGSININQFEEKNEQLTKILQFIEVNKNQKFLYDDIGENVKKYSIEKIILKLENTIQNKE